MTDTDLLDQFHSGSQAAFGELVQRHLGWVHASALRRTRDPHMADDVAQAVFIALAQSKRVPKGAAMSAWMFRIVQYASANLLRGERRRDHHEREAARQGARSALTPSDQREMLSKYLDRAVERLRKPDLQAVVLRFYEHKSVADVAVALGISEEGAKKRLSRAIVKLRTSLIRDGITIPADALSAAVQGATAISAGSAPRPMVQAIIRSSLHASAGTRAAAIAKSAIASFGSASIKVAVAGAFAAMILVPATAILVMVSRAPTQSVAAPNTTTISTVPVATSSNALAIGDRLKISIEDLLGPGIVSVYTPLIDPDGTVAMPLIPPIPLAGLSTADAIQTIRQRYADANLISHANLLVERIEQAGAPLTARGALKPGDRVVCSITDLAAPGVVSRLSQTISASGTLNLLHIGDIRIAGASESRAARLIDDAYRSANLISNAQAQVVRELPASVSLAPAALDARTGDFIPGPRPSTVLLPSTQQSSSPISTTTAPTTLPNAQANAQSLQLWQDLLSNRQLSLRATRSFDVQYTLGLHLDASPEGGPNLSGEVQHVHLIESDRKYFEQCSMDWTGASSKSSALGHFMAVAFDGRIGWRRDAPNTDTVIFGTTDHVYRMPSPSPLDFLSVVEPSSLQNRFDAGVFELVSARRTTTDGKETIEVRINSKRNGGRGLIIYSVDQQLMPIRLDDYTHDSLLQGESSIDEIKECHGADGTTVFFPVRAHRAAFSRRTKSLASQENLRVDEASLRVNIEVPDRTFALIPLSGERILNGDTGRYVTSDALPGLTGATTAP